MAASVVPVSISGGNHVKTSGVASVNSGAFVKTQQLKVQSRTVSRSNRNLSIRAQSNDRGSGGSGFLAGFILGGAVFGTLAYIISPKIQEILKDENEAGFKIARRPSYEAYLDDDSGLEKTRRTLSEKIGQLNSAIDNVSSRLRGGYENPKTPKVPRIPFRNEEDYGV